MSATTALELGVLAFGLVAFVLALAWLGRRPSLWDRAIAEHLRVTGRYPTAGEWRSGRIGEAARPKPARPQSSGPVTVTVTAVDGQPVAGGAR